MRWLVLLAVCQPAGGTLQARRAAEARAQLRRSPLEPVRSAQARWLPPGPGFCRVTVLDAGGAAARAAVRVQ